MNPYELQISKEALERYRRLYSQHDAVEFQKRLLGHFADACIYGTGTMKVSAECEHEWKQYVGFTDAYDFCGKCDKKRGTE